MRNRSHVISQAYPEAGSGNLRFRRRFRGRLPLERSLFVEAAGSELRDLRRVHGESCTFRCGGAGFWNRKLGVRKDFLVVLVLSLELNIQKRAPYNRSRNRVYTSRRCPTPITRISFCQTASPLEILKRMPRPLAKG